MSNSKVLEAIEANIAHLEEELAKNRQALAMFSGDELQEFGDNVVSLAKHKSKVAPKWRHKRDPNLTWSGRGRKPKWIDTHGKKIKAA